MTALRWGIMGTGGIARTMAGVLDSTDREVTAVGSSRGGPASELAGELRSCRVLPSHEAVAAAEDVDVVYVATTNDRHYANVLSCIEHGKAVLCEKPLGRNMQEARELVRASKGANVFLMEAMWMRFQPFFTALEQIIADDTVGPVGYVQANFSHLADTDRRRRWMNADLGGGAMADIGVYPLNLALFLLGRPLETTSQATIGPTGVDLETRVLSRHANDSVAVLSASFINTAPSAGLIAGPAGSIAISPPLQHSRMLTVHQTGREPTVIDVAEDGHGFRHEVDEVERCVRAGRIESELLPHSHTVAVAEWLDAIRACP